MSNRYFFDVFNTSIKRLRLIVPVVTRVHGEHHPELHEIKSLFLELDETTIKSLPNELELFHLFSQLRDVSHHYLVPDDACETYEEMLVMLKKLDLAYGKSV
ncbi:MAG: iron-sulfur cluster repair di-iron protein, ric [Erysipelotrichia bacterium]|jgi:regulator of cell morphogenesis and NO signaling|nr:iron-sulfur cluster repair di-iron protein, ric [Erysipelotrichia bacterium]